MDFSHKAFAMPKPYPQLSGDTLDHANLVMACRFGWETGSATAAESGTGAPSSFTTTNPESRPSSQSRLQSGLPSSRRLSQQQHTTAATFSPSPSDSLLGPTNRRFAPCRGRLYHQLLCGHRIRTDIVEDCGINCVEPFEGRQDAPFLCDECLEKEAHDIWTAREAEHNALYPPTADMSAEVYARWWEERQELEKRHQREKAAWEAQRRASTRPTNVCAGAEASEGEKEFAAQVDALSLTMCPSNETVMSQAQAASANRISLPTDSSEQLHWSLGSLSLAMDERGSCGVEYEVGRNAGGRVLEEEELWRGN